MDDKTLFDGHMHYIAARKDWVQCIYLAHCPSFCDCTSDDDCISFVEAN